MELLQVREREIFETLKAIKECNFVLIGGYAVNCYTLPRFSVDCDIVVMDSKESEKISVILKNIGYFVNKDLKKVDYSGKFLKLDKEILKKFRSSIDILISGIFDRRTGRNFDASWVFENSGIISLKGKTITESIKLRVINVEALAITKMLSCRNTDIRDIFMIAPQLNDIRFIKEEASKRCDFNIQFKKIKEKIISSKFKDDLQGVYGYINDNTFEKHKNAVLELVEHKNSK